MTISSAWNLTDSFTLIQAAYLWNDLDPPESSAVETIRRGGRPSNVSAVLQALQSADGRGLEVLYRDDVAKMMRNLFETVVAREELIRFARSKGEFPAFLFDTLGPSNAELTEQFNASASPQTKEPIAQNETPERTHNRGGRPPKYDWDGATSEIVRVAELDCLPARQADMLRHLKSWFASKSLAVPGDTQIKARISTIYGRLSDDGCIPSREVSD